MNTHTASDRVQIKGILSLLVALVAFSLPAIITTAAEAAVVSVSSGVLSYQADSGVANDVTIEPDGADYKLTDGAASLTAGSGCTAASSTVVRCSGVTSAMIELGDSADELGSVGGTTIALNVDGGDDDDTLTGGYGCDALTGNDGNDDLVSGPSDEDNWGYCANSVAGGNGDAEHHRSESIDEIPDPIRPILP